MTASSAETDIHAALAARYGGHAPASVASTPTIALQLRHHSVRRFLPEGPDEAELTAIIAAAQSASSSSNLQTWSVVEIRDVAHKAEVAALAGDQQFIRDAPVFLVFVADWARNRALAERASETSTGIEYLDSTLIGFVDAALAAQNAVLAAESLGYGTVFAGAVRNHPVELAALLGLPDGAAPVVGLAIGRRDPTDTAGVKPRLAQQAVRHRERYREATPEEIDEYDAALTAYQASQGRAHGWVETVVNRVRSVAGLHGRETMRASLERLGLRSR